MNLRPTVVPLTAKEFDRELCGYCAGCGCSCGYIAYLKDSKIVDLYGHPADPNGLGSLCTKGITYIQQLPENPLRIREPAVREGGEFKKISPEEAISLLKEWMGERICIFLDRQSDLNDTLYALGLTDKVYSDSCHLPFKPSSLPPQRWSDMRFILSLECDPVFSEVMATRWLVDAFESSAYILSVSTRYATTSAKASKRLLLSPQEMVDFLEGLLGFLNGKDPAGFGEDVRRTGEALSLIRESLILVGDSLLKFPQGDRIIWLIGEIVRRTGCEYSFVGDISPISLGGLEDFFKEAENSDLILMTGNPFIYADDEFIRSIEGIKKVYIGLFPNITAVHSDLVIPAKAFPEREFYAFRNGFGIRERFPKVLEPPGNTVSLSELLQDLGVEPSEMTTEPLPLLREVEPEEPPSIERDGNAFWIIGVRTLVEEMGHWNPWTHAIEREQKALMNSKTALALGVGDLLKIGDVEIPVEVSSNVADWVILLPDSFEEFQPFDPGVRLGRIIGRGKIVVKWRREDEH